MQKSVQILSFGLLFFFLAVPLQAQSKKKLQNRKKKLQNEIRFTEKQIKETRNQQKNSLAQLEQINQNISARKELIKVFESEIRLLQKQINEQEKEIKKLEDNITSLKQNYARMVYHAWINRHRLNETVFVLASDNFNEAFRRTQFLKRLGESRKDQLRVINEAKAKREKVIEELNTGKEEKTIALNESVKQANELQSIKKEQESVLAELRSKESELMANIKRKKSEREKLTAKINAIIEREIREANKRKNNSNNTTTKTNNTKSNTKVTGNTEGGSLSSGFESNKGKLPWPVEKGFISGKFGVHPHPVLSRVKVKNDGVDITTDKGAKVRTVYKGTVSGVFSIDGYENVVIVRHGTYVTVYSHLKTVSVSKDNKLTTKQNIGTAATNDEGKTFINFQVRKGSAVQNPAYWIAK